MLGAQALRTKQKVEQKEKEKKHRERLRSLELQRERIQKAAREDEAKFLEKMAHLHLEDAQALFEIAEETKRCKQGRHHSIHSTPLSSTRLAPIDESGSPRKRLSVSNKSSSTDFSKLHKSGNSSSSLVDGEESGTGNRILKFFGLSTSSSSGDNRGSSKKPPKRRMSTFT